jgi:hypothetical protein
MEEVENPHADRDLEPAKVVAGTISLGDGLADRAKPGDVVFVVVKQPRATRSTDSERFEVGVWPLDFRLTGAPGEEVVITAWIDHDGEIMTRSDGELEARALVKTPSADVKLVLAAP